MSQNQQVSSYNTEAVGQDGKQDWKKILFVWTGLIFSVSTMLYGGVVGSQLPLSKAILAILCGNLFLAVVTTLVSFMGTDTGLGAFELTKYSFGTIGGKIISLLRTIISLGWAGIGSILVVDLLSFFVPFFATMVGFSIGGIVINALFILTVWKGFHSLHKLSQFAIPAIILIFGVALFQADKVYGIVTLFEKSPAQPEGFFAVVIGVIFAWIDCVMVGSNFSRFAESRKDTAVATSLAFLLGATVIYGVGALTALATGFSSVPDIFNALGIAGLAGALIFLLTWTTSSENFYSGSLTFSTVFGIKNKGVLLFMAFAVATTFTLIDLFDYFIQWVNLMGLIFCPLIGVLLTDYFAFRQKYKLSVDEISTKISLSSVLACAVGVITNFIIPVYGSILALFTTAVAYYIFNKYVCKDKTLELANTRN